MPVRSVLPPLRGSDRREERQHHLLRGSSGSFACAQQGAMLGFGTPHEFLPLLVDRRYAVLIAVVLVLTLTGRDRFFRARPGNHSSLVLWKIRYTCYFISSCF
jgi:hypothetical protein